MVGRSVSGNRPPLARRDGHHAHLRFLPPRGGEGETRYAVAVADGIRQAQLAVGLDGGCWYDAVGYGTSFGGRLPDGEGQPRRTRLSEDGG